ncbi:hypothetical protein Tco_1203319 [Tanacetum coccineum]
MPHDQEFDTGNKIDQPTIEATRDDWFKKPDKPSTPDREWNKIQSVESRPPQTWISRITKEKEPPRTFDELMSTLINFSEFVMNRLKIENLTQETLVGPAYNLLKGTCKSFVEPEYHFEEVYKAVNDRLDWNNPEGEAYPFDLSKPLPLIQDERGCQVIPVNYFINNDLEYLQGRSSSRKYMTSTMKTKAPMYDNILGIKYMVPTLWSPTKIAYEKHVVWGVSHWGPKRKWCYGYACHFESNHDVFSTKRIIGVTHVKVEKWYDYGYLKEIEVQREDNQLYKFKEGDFPRLNLRDIEDLLLLMVQKKISNLEKVVLYDLNVALRMFTRCIMILKRVEDLQLGVESYQKKLNITRPHTFKSSITKLTPYTVYNDPQGIIYQDKIKRHRLICLDELYKFCDRTLKDVRSVLHDIANNLRMKYLPKRDWNRKDGKRSHIMIKAIDELLFERRLMRNLERFVSGREYGNDFRLLERTI